VLGLKELSIRACPSVTADGLLACVKLNYLKDLDYLTTVAVPESFVLQIARQNPSLESVSVFLSFMVDLEEMKASLKKINPRVTRLMNVVSF